MIANRASISIALLLACFSGFGCRTDGGSAVPFAGRVEIGEARMYYETRGSGPALLFLHAGIADSRMWDPQVEALSARYQTIRADMRGFGRTQMVPGEFSDHGDLAALLDSLGIEKAGVVGVSYGGQVAIDFALAYPDRVSALILGAPSLGGYPPHPDLIDFGRAEGEALEAGDIAAAVELNLRMWVDGPHREPAAVDRSLRARVGEMQRAVFEMEFPDGVQPLDLDPPASGRLGEIACPTLVLIGELETLAFAELAAYVAAEVPNANLQTLPGVAHMMSMEAPEAFNRRLVDFISKGTR